MAVFWVDVPCSLAEDYRRFRGRCCLHHQDYHHLQSKYVEELGAGFCGDSWCAL
ncbi:hypothetical protein L798_08072 [Zootermopsis nevadensis]|uniref:Uncharacterized protein n=1 Tax=Zootermopsis nevadensis TaxID=136037 RepID=A0A067R492_ZOONE|nr:hypothetical protein L798_08072 [Zootermopsis nevadensis]